MFASALLGARIRGTFESSVATLDGVDDLCELLRLSLSYPEIFIRTAVFKFFVRFLVRLLQPREEDFEFRLTLEDVYGPQGLDIRLNHLTIRRRARCRHRQSGSTHRQSG